MNLKSANNILYDYCAILVQLTSMVLVNWTFLDRPNRILDLN